MPNTALAPALIGSILLVALPFHSDHPMPRRFVPQCRMVYSLRRLRDDVVERRNPAAGLVVAGETIAAACCIGGSNIGNGPGPEAVVFCPVLSSGTLLLFWLILDRVASVNDTVTIERDRQAGLRLGAYLVATGAILGASVTGDWVSVEATTSDFLRYVWPLAILQNIRWPHRGN